MEFVYTIITFIFSIFFFYIFVLVVDFLKALKKYIDLKIIETEMKIDKDKF